MDPGEEPAMSPEPAPNAPLVAIVDDEEDITTYLGLALEDNGFRVVSTTQAAEAIPMLEKARPDLVCLDLLMPEQTGMSLYAKLVGHPHLGGIPILILSGLADPEEMPAILDQAGNLPEPAGFIEKPVDMRQFLGTVSSLLEWPARSAT
jgi:CheY-like chemotaxis protein